MRGPGAAAPVLCAGRTPAGASSLPLAVVTTRAAPLPDDVGCRSLAVASQYGFDTGGTNYTERFPIHSIDYFEGFTSRGDTGVRAATVIRLILTSASNRAKPSLKCGVQAPDAFYQFHINRQSLK